MAPKNKPSAFKTIGQVKMQLDDISIAEDRDRCAVLQVSLCRLIG